MSATPTTVRDGLLDPDGKHGAKSAAGAARVTRPHRQQAVLRLLVIDQLLPPEHKARAIVHFVEQLDLAAFYAAIPAHTDAHARPHPDPALLLALWLHAASEGVGSCRLLAQLCERDDAYRWICGGVHIESSTLRAFRIEHDAARDELLAQVLAVLMHQGFLHLKRIAQDPLPDSSPCAMSLWKCLKAAKDQVRHTRSMLDSDDPPPNDKARLAADRAARDRALRSEAALEELKKLQAGDGQKPPAE